MKLTKHQLMEILIDNMDLLTVAHEKRGIGEMLDIARIGINGPSVQLETEEFVEESKRKFLKSKPKKRSKR